LREGNTCFYNFNQDTPSNFNNQLVTTANQTMVIRSGNIGSLCPIKYTDSNGKKFLRYVI